MRKKDKIVQESSKNDIPAGRDYAPVPKTGSFPVAYSGRYKLPLNIPLSLHSHDCFEAGYCHEGEGIFIVENKILPFRGGDLCIICRDDFHIAQSEGGKEAVWSFLQFDPVFLLSGQSGEEDFLNADIYTGAGFNNIISDDDAKALVPFIIGAANEIEGKSPGWQIAAGSYLRCLMIGLYRMPKNDMTLRQEANRHDIMKRLAPALRIITHDYRAKITLGGLGRSCGMSVSHFQRVFRSAFGQAPMQYLRYYRLRLGAHYIRTRGMGVMEAAMAVGYEGPSTFHRHFKRMFKCSPCKWKKHAGHRM